MTPENIIAQIRQKANVVVLLVHAEDELSVRAQQAFLSQESRLRARGFQVYILETGPKTSASEELACVRAPQIRFFARGKLQQKIVGLFGEADIDAAMKVLI